MSFTPFHFEKTSTHETSGIPFKTVIEDYLLHNAEDEMIASIFSYSYLAQPERADKPVMFCYNGGPGASSSWVHIGLLGPKQVTFPTYPDPTGNNSSEYGENANFLLDCCDLVMVNPPGTAQTMITEEGKKKYYNTPGDAEAVSGFIQDWLRKYGREDAPVYLLGESYGTLRNLAVADALPENVNLQGIVSIGTSFNVGSPTTMLVEPNVRRLGANAACAWYHLHQDEKTQQEFVQEAMDFAYGEYAHALLMGNRLPAEEFEATLEKLHYYTGLDREILRAGKLRFDEMTYLTKMLPGYLVSAYDSRMKRPLEGDLTTEEWERMFSEEPFFKYADGAISGGLERYRKEDIEEPEGREQYDMLDIAWAWDYGAYQKDTLDLPVELMKENERLRFLFVAGYYDLQSTFDFVTYYLGRYDLPMDRVTFHVYNTGHAAYVGGDSASEVCEDIRTFIKKQ
ncbi:MAG: hypothetical protein IJH77_06415 [Mogibacterium sp.]|nr:hypothetical protein [Mogibacterium sp.]